MSRPLSSQIGREHSKKISILKSEGALGVTIADDGAGYPFIKKIKKGSVIDRIPGIVIGDCIEKVNNVWVIGKRHEVVAKLLREIPTGSTFTITLIEPVKKGFQGIVPQAGYPSGTEVLTLKADDDLVIEDERDEGTELPVEAINSLSDSFLEIHDSKVASQNWEFGADKTDLKIFVDAIDESNI